MRKVRVGANSPSLWPTMDSEMYTGTCLRPSWTAIVCPTMSGMIVERRDHVRITRLSRRRFSSSIFFSRWSSTKGPFFRLRAMSAPSPLAATADDELVGGLALARAALGLAPRAGWVAAAGALALAAAQRVVDRVHGHPAGGRALALPAVAAGLAPADQLLLGVADLADGGPAGGQDLADLARGHPQGGQRALLGQQLDPGPGRAAHLGPAARAELDVVDDGADGDVLQRQGVARLDVGALARLHQVADLEAGRGQDVALLAVQIVEQGQAGGAVRVVLDRRHLGRHAILGPAEVDDPVALLVAAALVPGGDAPVDVAATLLRARCQQRILRGLLGDLGEVGHRAAPPSRRGWLVLADAHGYLASKISILSSGWRVTSARLVALRTPRVRRVRLRLPLRCRVFTLETRTEKMAWTASLISVLLASGSTMKV